MNLSIRNTLIVALAALLLSGCSLFGKKDQPEYYGVPEAKPLVIPEGLDSPTSQTALTIEYPPVPLPERELNPVPPRVLANQTDNGAEANSRIRWAAEGVFIYVDDSTDSVDRRLGYAIERSGMSVHGRAPDGGYRFDYSQPQRKSDDGWFSWMAFWKEDPPNYSGSYLTLTQPDGAGSRVYLKYADGGEVPIDAAEHVLAILKQRLG